MVNSERLVGGGDLDGEIKSRAELLEKYFEIPEGMAGNPVFQREFFKHAMWSEGEVQIKESLMSIGVAERLSEEDGVKMARRLVGGSERIMLGEDGLVIITGSLFRPDGLSERQCNSHIKVFDSGKVGVCNYNRSVVHSADRKQCEARAEVVARMYDDGGNLCSYVRLDDREPVDSETLIKDVDFLGLEDLDNTRDGATVSMIDICPDLGAGEGGITYHVQCDGGAEEGYASGRGILSRHDGFVMLEMPEESMSGGSGVLAERLQGKTEDLAGLLGIGDRIANEFYGAIYGRN
jgi:hypothetical protein